jgi:hypothetical protein
MTSDAALQKIAAFDVVAATLKIGKGEYVPVGNIRYLVMLAREALGLPRVPGHP